MTLGKFQCEKKLKIIFDLYEFVYVQLSVRAHVRMCVHVRVRMCVIVHVLKRMSVHNYLCEHVRVDVRV